MSTGQLAQAFACFRIQLTAERHIYGFGHWHFLTFSCYRPLPLLRSARVPALPPIYKRV